MPSLIRKLFHKSEAPKDGLTQPQREAIVDLLTLRDSNVKTEIRDGAEILTTEITEVAEPNVRLEQQSAFLSS
jgi:hypothetical protein